jgi:hypothetical protein
MTAEMLSLLAQEIAEGNGEALSRLGHRLPSYRGGKSPTLSCMIRWVKDGVRGPNGERIYLEAARLAGRWVSTPQALIRFIERQTPQVGGEAPKTKTPGKRQRAAERAGDELTKLGI